MNNELMRRKKKERKAFDAITIRRLHRFIQSCIHIIGLKAIYIYIFIYTIIFITVEIKFELDCLFQC